MPISDASSKLKRRQVWLLALVAAFALLALTLHTFIRNQTLLFIVLHSESASSDAIEELLNARPNSAPLLWQLWHTRKISQRQSVVEHLKNLSKSDFPADMISLLHLAALDPDANLRELALGILRVQRDPQLRSLARAQLQDADPQLRMLGIHYLHDIGDASLTSELIPLLNDPEPAVVVTANAVLRGWTGNDFGIRMFNVVSDLSGDPKSLNEPTNVASLREGADKWRAWWQLNRTNYAAMPPPDVTFPSRNEAPLAGNFALKDLSGHTVHLSDFKGKTVLLNFWTTWCPGCQEEMPRLVELQQRHPNDLVILSVSLDGAPLDDDDDSPVKAGGDDASAVRKKIERLVKTHGINYSILLDPKGDVGVRFNGQELPTNVIIDPEGRVRRRFIGARSVAAFEAMLIDAEKP